MKKNKQPKTTETSAQSAREKWHKVAGSSTKPDEVWDRLMKIGEELGKGWQNEKSALEILSEMRR
jgi:hypothetical protein